MSKKVFVSGASGVIGSELIPMLLENDYQVYAADLKPCPPEWIDKVLYYHGDLNEMPEYLWKSFKPEVFIHLAATFERTTESLEFWDECYHHNTKLSHFLMSLAKETKETKKILFASSYLTYAESQYLFSEMPKKARYLKESDSLESRNLIGNAKLSHEAELKYLSKMYPDKDFIIARIFRGYGRGSKDVVSRWVRALIKGEQITVYRPEGIFDYVYGKDSAEGLLRLSESEFKGIVNLGTGSPRMVGDVINCLKTHFPGANILNVGSDLAFEASAADVSLLRSTINWVPTYKLETAIPEIIEYEKKQVAVPVNEFGNIAITSSSTKVPLIKAAKSAAKRISKDIKIIGLDSRQLVVSSYLVDIFIKTEQFEDSEFFFKYMLDICVNNNVKSIIPTRDQELVFYAKYKKRFSENSIHVMVSDLECVQVCYDKFSFASFLRMNSFVPMPTFTSLGDVLKFESIVVKERYGSGSDRILLDVSPSAKDLAVNLRELSDPIFQPYIKGVEFSIDVYVSQTANVIDSCVRKRNIVVLGESQVTTEEINIELKATIEALALKLGIKGHAVFQAIQNDQGFFILECNARFGGASTLGVSAGVDSFHYFLYEQYFGKLFNPLKKSNSYLLRQVRFKSDLISPVADG